MRRISTDMANNDLQFRMRRQESDLQRMQSRMATQNRIQDLRDDPLAAAHAVRYDSYLERLGRFEQNALYAKDHYQLVDGYMRQAQDIMQRVRELAVQGANGVYAQEDMAAMGVEINELLEELIQVANSTGIDGKRVFAGDKSFTEPFRTVEGSAPGSAESVVTGVVYQGSGSSRLAEVDEAAYADLDLSGGEVFWAERMQIFSGFDATAYRVGAPSSIFVDGQEILLSEGDTIHAIVAKINESPAPVKAYVDPDSRGLVIEGTDAHQIRLEDAQGSSVLQELGILRGTSDPAAPNWHQNARVSGGSLFDMVIRLRDALNQGDSETVGSLALGGIDLAMDNLNARMAQLGSRQERVESTWKRLNESIPDVAANLARETALDFTTAATDLGMLEFAHKATMQTASRLIQPTLLDYLK